MANDAKAPADVVAAYHEALVRRDFDAARSLLRTDLRFRGPFDEFDRADAYLAAVQGLWGIVEAIEVKHRSSAGDEVVVLYEMATRTPAGTQLVCEWFGVENGSIAWIRALFDTAPFAFLRSSAGSR
jgi:limonene-1,2-epoxide hydrolase